MSSVFAQPLAALPDPLPLPGPSSHVVQADVTPPGSKSLTNRLVLLAALATGESELRNPLIQADDAQRMLQAVSALGAETSLADDPGGAPRLRIRGAGGRFRAPVGQSTTLDLGGSGTATRFLAAASVLATSPVTLDGNPRMRQRPIGELASALSQLGASVEHLGEAGFPPIRVTPPDELPESPTVTLDASRSSQFASALLMIGPFLPGGLTLRLTGAPASAPYLRMTGELLHRFGAGVRTTDDLRVLRVSPPPARPQPGLDAFRIDIEPDASGATYWWAAGALRAHTTIHVRGLPDTTTQGDAAFTELLHRMGARVHRTGRNAPDPADHGVAVLAPVGVPIEPILADLSDMPDAAMTLAVVASFAKGRSILRGLSTLRIKETDRIAALQAELAKIGVQIETPVMGDTSAITITPPDRGVDCSPNCPPVRFDTYDDHRMAMSLALVSLRRPNVFINDPACVAKTYPSFWQEFGRVLIPGDRAE
ncbi:MAG: 3-phosphoshikimate 1-carboxyvinyltransferase [Phycisphaerales bacterium]|nr:MAG: 3-phosphoshikimate 1-carboxyvinyltransferase [Phycisphaerales bacterium]